MGSHFLGDTALLKSPLRHHTPPQYLCPGGGEFLALGIWVCWDSVFLPNSGLTSHLSRFELHYSWMMAPGCRTLFVPARRSGSSSAILYRPGELWQADPRLFPAPSWQRSETHTVLLALAFAVLTEWRCAVEGLGSSASRPAGLLSSKESKSVPPSLSGLKRSQGLMNCKGK